MGVLVKRIKMVDYVSASRVIIAGVLLCVVVYGCMTIWRGIKG